MRKLEEIDLREKKVIVYGCGERGRKCILDLKEKNAYIVGCCDSDSARWGGVFEGFAIMNPEEVYKAEDIIVVVAARYVMDLVELLTEKRIKFCIWYFHNFYHFCENWKLLNCTDVNEVYKVLDNKKLVLCGTKKHREDIKYIFNNVHFKKEIDNFEKIEDGGADIFLDAHTHPPSIF